ncbi:MAG: NYN domain-containing protein [Candidatus Lokiarchaeota archaeon]|nr:NYN domain-containing protein [Candidatus Lokiarchaeota archaeon]
MSSLLWQFKEGDKMTKETEVFNLYTKNFKASFKCRDKKSYYCAVLFKNLSLPELISFNLIGTKLEVKKYIYSFMQELEDALKGVSKLFKLLKELLKRTQNVAVFCDFPNLDISIRNSGIHRYPNFSLIKDFISLFGVINEFRVYGDWNLLQNQRKYLKSIPGLKLINEPHLKNGMGKKKDVVDTRIAFDIGMYSQQHPEIDMYVIIAGDADFLPFLREIRTQGKKIIIVAEKNSLSHHLSKKFENIITYQEIVENFTQYNLNLECKCLERLPKRSVI